MRADERTTKNTNCCRSYETLDVVARRLWDGDCDCLPVVDERGDLHGKITDRDICMAAMATGKPLAELRVADAMTTPVAGRRLAESRHEAEFLGRGRDGRDLPVVGDRSCTIGQMACNDLVRWIDDGGRDGGVANGIAHDILPAVRLIATTARKRSLRRLRGAAHTNAGAGELPRPSVRGDDARLEGRDDLAERQTDRVRALARPTVVLQRPERLSTTTSPSFLCRLSAFTWWAP